MSYDKREIGNRIAKLRKLHRITQEQFAEALDVTPKHVSSVERGLAGFALEKLDQICDLLDTNLDYLVYGRTPATSLDYVPDSILQIIESDNSTDIELLREYLVMFSRLRKETLANLKQSEESTTNNRKENGTS